MIETIDEKIKRIVHRAYKECPYYHSLYTRLEVDIDSFSGSEDLEKLPIITSLDLCANSQQFRSKQVVPYRVTSSSGTVGLPKTLYRTSKDTATSVEVMCRLFELATLKTGDVLWIGQPFDLAHLGYLCLEACRSMGILAIPGGLSVTDERMLTLLSMFRPNAIFTSPSRMGQITRYYASQGEKPWNLTKILLAGEPCSSELSLEIQTFWQVQAYDLYGSEETDGLAGACQAHTGLHFMNDQFYLELVEPNTDRPTTDTRRGEAVITSLYCEGTPLIRYRLGDIIELIPGQCSCGHGWPRIKVIGRSEQPIYLYDGIKLYSFQIRSALNTIFPYLKQYQAVVRKSENNSDEIEIIIPSIDSMTLSETSRLEAMLWSSSLDLAAAKDIGKLRFRFTPNGTMLTTKRGKTPELMDLR